MNAVERTALLVHRDTIVQSVDLVYIKDSLIANGVINNEEMEEIDYEVNENSVIFVLWLQLIIHTIQKTRSAKVRKLLDLLPRKGPKTFPAFVEILERDYDWLAETLGKFNNRDSPDACSQQISNPLDHMESLTTVLQESLIAGGIPFPPTHLIPRSQKVSSQYFPTQVSPF